LLVDEALREEIRIYLDQYRLLTTNLHIREPNYLGVKVRAEIVLVDFSLPEEVQARVAQRLKDFISPLRLRENIESQDAILGEDWEGWPFGRDLYVAEIFSLIQRVPGVKHVIDVELSQRLVIPGNETPPQGDVEEEEEGAIADLAPVEGRVIRVPDDTLLCSLAHEIEVVEL